MQVERKPSRWPYVVTLVYLLILCFTVPRYWRSTREEAARPDPPAISIEQHPGSRPMFIVDIPRAADGSYSLFGTDGSSLGSGYHDPTDFAAVPKIGLPELNTRPTVEELLSSLDILNGSILNEGDSADAAGTSVDVMPSLPPNLAGLAWLKSSPWFGWGMSDAFLAEAFQYAGRKLADLEPHEWALLMPRTGPQSSAMLKKPESPKSSVKFSEPLLLVKPHHRVAVVPPPARLPATTPRLPRVAQPPSFLCPWSRPTSLLDQLQLLSRHPYSSEWARDATTRLESLTARDKLPRGQAAPLIDHLRMLSDEAAQLANEAGDDVLRAELLRAHWGLERRLDCWSPMREIASRSTASRRVAARDSLGARFGIQPGQAVEPVDVGPLSADLESYEQSPTPPLARAIREKQREMWSTSDVSLIALADAVDAHYRNANVRIAVTDDMLNRFMPGEHAEVRPVRDRIAGTPVRGRSHTYAESRVELEPDTGTLRLELETDGTVASVTKTEGGPATLRSRATTNFTARKPILVGANGVSLPRSDAYASNRSQVLGVYSYFDWIPFLGSYIRHRAIQQYREKRPQAEAEVEYKVAARARHRLDRRADTLVLDMEDKVRQRLIDPLQEYGISLVPIELQTTDERVVARVRIAGDQQLGSHTPRPTAPADSLASVQVHESALTNAAVALELDGKRLTAVELRQQLRDKIPQLQQAQPTEQEENGLVFQFADRDAVKVRMTDGQLQLTLALAELDYDGERMRDFNVHAYYRPQTDGIEVELVRDGALGIEGRLGAGERARLHNIFNEVFSEERRLPLMQLDEPTEDRWAGLTITQLVLEDGWMGLAIGPDLPGRTAERSRSLR